MLTVYLYDADGNQTATIQNPVYDMEEGTFYVDEDVTIAETDGEGHVTNYQYDAEGNLIEVESADGSKITYAYDVEQEDGTTATVMTDAKGNQSIYRGNRSQSDHILL